MESSESVRLALLGFLAPLPFLSNRLTHLFLYLLAVTGTALILACTGFALLIVSTITEALIKGFSWLCGRAIRRTAKHSKVITPALEAHRTTVRMHR